MKLTNLTRLSLVETRLSNATFQVLAKTRNDKLEVLDLTGLNIRVEYVEPLVDRFPNLTKLEFRHVAGFDYPAASLERVRQIQNIILKRARRAMWAKQSAATDSAAQTQSKKGSNKSNAPKSKAEIEGLRLAQLEEQKAERKGGRGKPSNENVRSKAKQENKPSRKDRAK